MPTKTKTAKAAPAAKPATEAKPSKALISREHALAAANYYRAAIADLRASVPIKSALGFNARKSGDVNTRVSRFTARQREAAIYILAATGAKLADKTSMPRRFTSLASGNAEILENGCAGDMRNSGFATFADHPQQFERITLSSAAIADIRSNIGDKKLKALKLI